MLVAVTAAEMAFLARRGWDVKQVFDACWLDCARDGYLLTVREPGGGRPLAICLCPEHALFLEAGVYAGEYSGAPLPPETMADEWPWRYAWEVSG